MPLRITLSDEQPPPSAAGSSDARVLPQSPSASRPSRFVDWEDPSQPTLLLLLPREPEPGMRFHYAGADWEVVDYRDGWVAGLVMD